MIFTRFFDGKSKHGLGRGIYYKLILEAWTIKSLALGGGFKVDIDCYSFLKRHGRIRSYADLEQRPVAMMIIIHTHTCSLA
jgi:hypothetical protein